MFLLENNEKKYFIESSKDLLFIRNLFDKRGDNEQVFLFDKFLNGVKNSNILEEIEENILDKEKIIIDNITFNINNSLYICDHLKIYNLILEYKDVFYKCSKISISNIYQYINYLEKINIINYNKNFCNLDNLNNLSSFVFIISDENKDISKLENISVFNFNLLSDII